jgi:hypothetical protein
MSSRVAKPKGLEVVELPGMPGKDNVGKLAEKYLRAREGLEAAKEAIDLAAGDLIAGMAEAERPSISLNGKTMTVKHIVKDAIAVRTSREK